MGIQIVWMLSCVFLIVGIVSGAFRVSASWRFLAQYKKDEKYCKLRLDYHNVAIIIPLYEEQKIVERSVQNFMSLVNQGIHVYYVTTKKEMGDRTTKEVLKEIIAKEGIGDRVHIVDCPYKKGVMAHQLNYAIDQLDEDTICFIYNVDSVIDIRTVNYVLEHKKYLREGVFQQYSYSERMVADKIINSAIYWQNRWAIAFELPKVVRAGGRVKLLNFNYVIGHGLVFTKKMYNMFNHFSEMDINEDNVLGYVLNFKKIPIYPIPYLEKIDFAYNVATYLCQQETWFNGPLYAFQYFRNLRRKQYSEFSDSRMFLVACLNFRAALNWLAFPILCIIGMVGLCMAYDFGKLLVLVLLLFLYVRGVNVISEKCLCFVLEDDYQRKNRFSVHSFFWLFIHTIGPIRTLLKVLCGKNSQMNKRKTEKI